MLIKCVYTVKMHVQCNKTLICTTMQQQMAAYKITAMYYKYYATAIAQILIFSKMLDCVFDLAYEIIMDTLKCM